MNKVIDETIQSIEQDKQKSENKKIEWYLLDKEGTFVKVWDFGITILIIYSIIVTPFILVFQDSYQKWEIDKDSGQKILVYEN